MQLVIENMHRYQWLQEYASLEGIEKTIDQVSKRIRFENSMAGGIEEVEQLYLQIEQVFLALFSHLQQTVLETAHETK